MKFKDCQNLSPAMKKARDLSLRSLHLQYRVGAVIIYKSSVLATGFNQKDKTHPFLKTDGFPFNQSIHAEMHAIFRMKNKENLKGATVVVYRETKDGHLANSRPCAVCQKLLRKYGIKKIQYCTPEGIIEEKIDYSVEIEIPDFESDCI